MALRVVDVLSWPWVQMYAAFSACLLTGCIYSVYEEAKDPFKQTVLMNKLSQDSPAGRTGDDNVNNEELYATVLWYHDTESFCIWVSGQISLHNPELYGSLNDLIATLFFGYII